MAIAAIVVVVLFVLVFGPARAVRSASSGETQLVPRKLASFCFAFNPCPVTCCGNVKSHIVKPSCHSLHESLMQNSLTLAMVAVVTVVGFAVVFGFVRATDAACGKPQVALSPATASSCLPCIPPLKGGWQPGGGGWGKPCPHRTPWKASRPSCRRGCKASRSWQGEFSRPSAAVTSRTHLFQFAQPFHTSGWADLIVGRSNYAIKCFTSS